MTNTKLPLNLSFGLSSVYQKILYRAKVNYPESVTYTLYFRSPKSSSVLLSPQFSGSSVRAIANNSKTHQ